MSLMETTGDDDESSLSLRKLLKTPKTVDSSDVDSAFLTYSVNSPSLLQPNSKCSKTAQTQENKHSHIESSFLLSSVDPVCDSESFRVWKDTDYCYSWLQKRKRNNASESSVDSSSNSSSLPLPPPPDGGWGWFVVFGAFIVCLICDGLAFSFGVLYSELLVQFGESRSKTSMVGSIFFGVAMILGPLASALTTRFGCRNMTIVGGLLSSFGFTLSHFANSVEMLCFTFSVVVGAGFSFCYITSVVIVAFYFEKRRALATGLSVCGTGVGTFTFAPLVDYLISEYGWRGLFLIMAGISLNLVVCGMLFRPLQFTDAERWQMLLQEFNKIPNGREDIEFGRKRFPSQASECESDEEPEEEDPRTISVLNLPTFIKEKALAPSVFLMEALKNSKNPDLTLHRYLKNALLRVTLINSDNKSKLPSSFQGSTYTITANTPITKKDDKTADDISESLLDSSNQNSALHWLNVSDVNENAKTDASCSESPRMPRPTRSQFIVDRETAAGGKIPQPVLLDSSLTKIYHKNEYTVLSCSLTDKGSVREDYALKKISSWHMARRNALGIHLPLFRTDIFYRRLLRNSVPDKQCVLSTSCPELFDAATAESRSGYLCRKAAAFFEDAGDIFSSMLDFHLFSNPFFVIFVTSNFLYYFWSDVPYMYAADHAINNGVEPTQASFTISIIGIFNTVGQVVFGFVGDMRHVNLLNVYAVVSTLAGSFVAVVPFMNSYWNTCVMYAFFGFTVSVSYPLTTVLLVHYLGVERLTNAYGLLMLMQGIANLFGPPFAGWISDLTGSYNYAFYLSGFFYALSGLVLFCIYIPRFKVKERHPTVVTSTSIGQKVPDGVGHGNGPTAAVCTKKRPLDSEV